MRGCSKAGTVRARNVIAQRECLATNANDHQLIPASRRNELARRRNIHCRCERHGDVSERLRHTGCARDSMTRAEYLSIHREKGEPCFAHNWRAAQ
jgi:hypothetical protein